MKKSFFPLILIAVLFCGAADASVRPRPQSSRADSLSMALCGSLLCTEEDARTVVYAPFRRRGPSGCDEGMIAKFIVDDGGVTRVWSSTGGVRQLLAAPAEQSRFIPGPLVKIAERSAEVALAAGLELAQMEQLNTYYANKELGAPYPAAMTRVKDVLYVQTDDGLVCAFDASDGRGLWAFIPPQVLRKERAEAILAAVEAPPWLLAGALSAEKIEEGGTSRVLLWGTLGAGGSGLYCIDVTMPEAPLFCWAREKSDDGDELLWGVADSVTLELGDTAAAPVVAPVASLPELLLPSGAGVQGKLWALAPASGIYLCNCTGEEGIALKLSPLVMQSAKGRLSRVIVGDVAGGVQEFVRKDDYFELSYRLDLRSLTGSEDFDLHFSPLLCPLSRGNWLAFVGSAENSTIVVACPAPLRERSWSDLPWRGGSWGWYHHYEGFHSLMSALFSNGLLYLLGREDGRIVVKAVDITGSRLVQTVEAAQDSVALVSAAGKVLTVSAGDGTLTAVPLSVMPPSSAAILYTLYR